MKSSSKSAPYQGLWLTPQNAVGGTPSWHAYRGEISWKGGDAVMKIGADSKYWLYVNGALVVREGGLKRGPSPDGTYVDTLDLASCLQLGNNRIAILVWYFGREGFSHKDSGRPGLYLESTTPALKCGRRWKCRREEAYYDAGTVRAGAYCGYRLPEHSIGFDARRTLGNWTSPDYDDSGWPAARIAGQGETAPWGTLVERPIPQFHWGEQVPFTHWKTKPDLSGGRILIGKLPFNHQFTPWIRLKARPGLKVEFHSDAPTHILMAEYLTTDGDQEWESPGWINGHELHLRLPAEAEVIAWGYRPTGYDTTLEGSFTCSDKTLNDLWGRSARTLLITMRDTFMDCPCRERAQWWGDEVIQLNQVFYCLDERAHSLVAKGVRELAAWQRNDGVLFSPIPAGNWAKELPSQMLASVGRYGFWSYYRNTADVETIREVFPAVTRYLELWGPDAKGFVIERNGEWTWGDWGTNIDLTVIDNAWLYLAWEGAAEMAKLLGEDALEKRWRHCMVRMTRNFRRRFWRDRAFRSAKHDGPPDDRASALAVLAGFHRPEDVPDLLRVFRRSRSSSPYMEKYVLEALFRLGKPGEALKRMKERHQGMLATRSTTLWEKFPEDTFQQNTYNHSWSGGPLTLLCQYVAGIEPATPGWDRVKIQPQPGDLTSFVSETPTPRGILKTKFQTEPGGKRGRYQIDAPENLPVDWDLSLVLPKRAKLRSKGKWLDDECSGRLPGGRLRLEWEA